MVATSTIVGGVFARFQEARKAVRELRAAGFADDQIGLVTRGSDGTLDRPSDAAGKKGEEGTGVGIASGAASGTGLGLAVIAGLLSPFGPVVAGGALIGILSAGGDTAGGLVGLGLAQEEADYFEQELQSGKTLVTVSAPEDMEEAIDILQRTGGKLRLGLGKNG